jgi:hypothetical protein
MDWKKKERNDAKDFGGRQTKASGSQWFQPGDVRTSKYLIDSKYTDKMSYTITKKIWDKIYEEALFSYRTPMLSVQIQDLELVILSKEDFIKLLGE